MGLCPRVALFPSVSIGVGAAALAGLSLVQLWLCCFMFMERSSGHAAPPSRPQLGRSTLGPLGSLPWGFGSTMSRILQGAGP